MDPTIVRSVNQCHLDIFAGKLHQINEKGISNFIKSGKYPLIFMRTLAGATKVIFQIISAALFILSASGLLAENYDMEVLSA